MPNQTLTDSQADAKAWFAASQWSAFKGEMRVNQLRLAAIVVFYLTHLFHYMGLDQFLGLPAVNSIIPENQAVPFHQAVTAMAVAWLCVVAAVRTCLSVPYFPAALPYISTTMDTLLLSILLYATRGPASARTRTARVELCIYNCVQSARARRRLASRESHRRVSKQAAARQPPRVAEPPAERGEDVRRSARAFGHGAAPRRR